MITDAEFYFWIVCGVLCILFLCALPFINNYLQYKETQRMFENR
jgi:hypothetical protein